MIHAMREYFRFAGLQGLLCALKGTVTGSVVPVTLRRNDCAHPFRLRVPSPDIQAYRQIFIEGGYDVRAQRRPDVIVDAGAHIGLASIYFANRYPGAVIIAIEPEQHNFRLLEENTRPYPAVHPVHAALWSENEEVSLLDPGLGNWGFMTAAKRPDASRHGTTLHAVRGITLDRLMEEFGLPRVNILKLDIEGAEKEVFSDTSPWIDRIDSIIIELHERMKAGCENSFYRGAQGFDGQWKQRENVCLSRDGVLARGRP